MINITPNTSIDDLKLIHKNDIITNSFKTGMVTHIISEKFETYISFVFCIKPYKIDPINTNNYILVDCEFTELIYHRIKTF